MERIVTVGFLGCGNVGGGVWRLLNDFGSQLAHRTSLQFQVKKVLVRDLAKRRDIDFPAGVLTDCADDVLNDPEIEIVIEVLGGEMPAYEWMHRALTNGKTVITANKAAFALHWHSLQKAAKESGAGLYYEAAVCGAIPIIHCLEESLQANWISKMYGIVNGTTNYILSRMSKSGESFEAALAQAQELGLAEPDPSSDVEGLDAAYKLTILASLAFHGRVPFESVDVEGITRISADDVKCGQELGYTLKLLAIAKRDGLKVETRVHPTFIRNDHPLSNISGALNAVFVTGHACKEMMFMGQGAGDMPTASAIVSDLIRAAQAAQHHYPTFENNTHPTVALEKNTNWKSAFYIRLLVKDEPGVLSRVAKALADENVSIAAVRQIARKKGEEQVMMTIITHAVEEQAMKAALRGIGADVGQVASLICVEDEV